MKEPENFEPQSSPFRGRGGMEAIILAGGLGTRLRSVVSDVPKCMAPVNGIPFLHFIISYLKKEGVERFIFSLGYKSEIVTEYVDRTFPEIDREYVIEDSPLGTGGAIKLACSKVKGTDVLILNGDTLFNINLEELLSFHKHRKSDFTVALKEMTAFSRYGAVEIDRHFEIKAFHEKKYCEKGLINGGVYVLNKHSLLKENLPDVFSFEKDFLEANVGRLKFTGLECAYYFIDIGIPEDYDRFIKDFNLIFDKSKYSKKDTGTFILEFFFEALYSILIF